MGGGASTNSMIRTAFPHTAATDANADHCEAQNPQICWFCDEFHLGLTTVSDKGYPPLSCCRKCLALNETSDATYCSISSGKSAFQSTSKLRNIFQYVSNSQRKGSEQECTNSTCGICQNVLCKREDRCRLLCGHTFHECCIGLWFNKHSICPTCRYDAKNCNEWVSVQELVAENSEEQLCEKVLALQYLAASVSEIGNIDSGDIFMSHLICSNDEPTKRELADKFHSLLTPKKISTNSTRRNDFFLHII
jgi:Ring finger domain